MPVNGDRLAEPNETFVVNLSSATNATIADGQGVGTIVDDEPRISISDVTKTEGKKSKTTLFTFTVTLSAAYDQPVTMSFRTVNGTATTSDNDYVAKTGTLTFAPGETTKTITIEVKGDSKREANETFYLDLFGNSSNSLFTKNRGIGTILCSAAWPTSPGSSPPSSRATRRPPRELLPLVYDELRKLAAARLAQEKPGPDAPGHRPGPRGVPPAGRRDQPQDWNGRGHFFAAAAEAMRRILVETRPPQAAAASTAAAGSALDLDEPTSPVARRPDDDLLALDEALDRLAPHDPPAAELVKLRYFAGLTVEEAAEALGISPRHRRPALGLRPGLALGRLSER